MPILRISAVRPLELDARDIRYATVDEEIAEQFRLAEGDLLFTRYSGSPAYVGACAVVTRHAIGVLHPDKLIRGVVKADRVMPDWIAMVVSTGIGRRAIEARLKTTAGQVGIAGGELKQVPVPVAPMIEQIERVERWAVARSALERMDAAIARGLSRSAGLRKALLSVAFSGGLTK
jgi:type I restriction enzyme S subunit